MNSTTLVCKQCKAPLEYEDGSAVLRCPHCGYKEKIDESDEIIRERIWAKTHKETEVEKTKIEKDADIKVKSLGIKKVKWVLYVVITVFMAFLIGWLIYNGQHRGKIHIKQTSDYYIGTDYQVVHRLLTEAGFENIEDSPQATLSKKEQVLEGKVIRVSIDGNPAFEKGWFSKDSAVTIYYSVLDPKRANDVRMPLSRTDCIGKSYRSIVDKLTAEGFHNIKLVPYADLSMDRKEQDGKITRISISDSEEFYLGDYFAADSIIQIDYHTLDPERMADVQIPVSYDSFSQKDYMSACNDFFAAGFTNITLIPKYDIGIFDNSKNGEIQSIAVNGENTFLKGTWLPCDTEVRITYRAKEQKYLGENYLKVQKMLSTMGFKDVELMAKNDLGTQELKKDGQVVSVLIDNVEMSEAEKWNLLAHVTIQYHSEQQANTAQVKVTTASKDLLGEQYKDVVSNLKEMGFINVTATALEDLSNGILHKDGSVSKISIGDTEKFSVGEIFDKSAAVIVSYHSLKPKSTPTAEAQPSDGQIIILVEPKELKGKDYQEVFSVLKEMGFTNITQSPLCDLKKGWLHNEGEVKNVSIAGVTKFSANDIFDSDAEVTIFYHSFPTK